MYLRIETYNFGLEAAREHKAGKLTSVRRKVILALMQSDLENQKRLRKKFWDDWDNQQEVVKIKVLGVRRDYKRKAEDTEYKLYKANCDTYEDFKLKVEQAFNNDKLLKIDYDLAVHLSPDAKIVGLALYKKFSSKTAAINLPVEDLREQYRSTGSYKIENLLFELDDFCRSQSQQTNSY